MVGADQDYGIYLNVGTLLALVGAVATTVLKITRIERTHIESAAAKDQELREEMEAKFENMARDLSVIERANVGRYESHRHEVGEMGAALRQKIHDVEVLIRDRFVPRETFDTAITRIQNSIDKLGDRLEAKIDRLPTRD